MWKMQLDGRSMDVVSVVGKPSHKIRTAAEDIADDDTTLELAMGRAVAALELADRVEDEAADDEEDLLLVVVVSSSSSSPSPGIWIRGTRVVNVEVKVVSASQ